MHRREGADPVRATVERERVLLAGARATGPFVAWRDAASVLRVEVLKPNAPVVAGRSTVNPIVIDLPVISREHVELLRRVRGVGEGESVYMLDLRSRQGTEHRVAQLADSGPSAHGQLQRTPAQPARPLQLGPGDHDVKLARSAWLLVGGVRPDTSITLEADEDARLEPPTPRQRDVLVELCRPLYERGTTVATPTNDEIALRVTPRIKSEHISTLIGQMYKRYNLNKGRVQNRLDLAELALHNEFVGPRDYA